jgi:O-antigen/teichoic acid export membrane protein
MLNYSYPILFAGLAGTINDSLDRVLLLHYLPKNVDVMAEIGIYGANIKIAVIMVLFTQMFRFAAEPFFFNQNKDTDQKIVLADVTKYFTMIGILIFLFVMLYIDVLKFSIQQNYWDGLKVVPINLLSSFILGIYFNLSFWYKLTGKTFFGIIITCIGALITIILNIIVIPRYGYMGSAWVRLLCYLVMVGVSYYWGQIYYPVKYNVNKLITYIGLGIIIYIICCTFKLSNLYLNLFKNTIVFIGIIYFFERRENLISIFFKKNES